MICAECEDYELRRDHPLQWAGVMVMNGLIQTLARPSPAQVLLRTWSGSMSAIMGAATGRRRPTHYEQHRDAYVVSGDALELERMLRQVKA